MPWYVLYTKSRNEKVVAEKLRLRNIDVFCPLIKTKRKWSDRVKIVEEPLFRSYCFVNLEDHQRAQVFDTPGIVRYLYWLNKPAIVRDMEIVTIKHMLNEVDHDLIQLETFSPASQVTITSGAFKHTEGSVINQQGKNLSLYINSLQMVVKIDLSKNQVSV
ncbi:UpxY family transcription antiterminator [Spirosoma utsteinense]|uniref:Transcription antitermination factor NusG n=1 Tax=Spirosoma utsteinense TaxID=2585773 RepID=A0ABR6WFH4_9BACT|nr:UpxY family transcription antiterminator [Spirosoma utsteinense]MBC3789115.1 transcription antitermination factor NusG [Spirosoma utsteinense]MBC3795019.1 transcription antitermination factor NusG [Spirosoma utsteinense]